MHPFDLAHAQCVRTRRARRSFCNRHSDIAHSQSGGKAAIAIGARRRERKAKPMRTICRLDLLHLLSFPMEFRDLLRPPQLSNCLSKPKWCYHHRALTFHNTELSGCCVFTHFKVDLVKGSFQPKALFHSVHLFSRLFPEDLFNLVDS